MKFKEKLKKIIIDNILAMIISFVTLFGSGYIMFNQILTTLRPLWFLIFFISFAVFMYNVVVLMKVEHLGKRFMYDIKDLSDGKIDGKQNGKPIE